MRRRYRVSRSAKRDLLDIWLYVAKDNVSAADRLTSAIEERFQTLVGFPRMGQTRDDLRPGLRSLPVGRYLIFYHLEDSGILINRVLHGARNIRRLF